METEKQYFQRKGIIRAVWCVDSETSEECLVDLDRSVVIAKRVNGIMVYPNKGKDNE